MDPKSQLGVSNINIVKSSLRRDLFVRFMAALIMVQLTLLVLGVAVVSSLISNEQKKELRSSVDKSAELFGMLARYGDVRYAKFVVSAGIGSNGLREFRVFDLQGEEIQASDPTKLEHASPNLLEKVRAALAGMKASGQYQAYLVDQEYFGHDALYRYAVKTSDGADYLLLIKMGIHSLPWLWICLALFCSIIVSSFSAFYIARTRIGSPVLAIETYASQVRAIPIKGDTDFLIPYSELIPIHSAIIEMVNNLKEQAKQVAMAQMIQMLSHDLRAPLGIFERLLQIPSTSFDSMRDRIKESLHRINAMIESFRHSDLESHIKTSITSVQFDHGLDSLLSKASKYEIQIIPPLTGIESINVDLIKFERAWINLASNAIEAAKSLVKIEWEQKGTVLCLRVIDDGLGVPKEISAKLFERGVTFGKVGGTGLGLSYVRQIMQGHGGDVSYRRENVSTIFECCLPNAFPAKTDDNSSNPAATTHLPMEFKLNHIAICLVPSFLAESIRKELDLLKIEGYSFSCEYTATTDIAIVNNDEALFKAMDDNRDFIQVSSSLSEAKILDRLIRKFTPTKS